jgi:hypothetical protein
MADPDLWHLHRTSVTVDSGFVAAGANQIRKVQT